MSKISLEPNASGAGTFSIISPDSNTNRTLNLPDESGTILSDVSTNIPGSGIVGQLDPSVMPSGSVIQVQQTYIADTDNISTTSTSFVASGISVSITPFRSDSVFYISYKGSMQDHRGGSASTEAKMYVNDSPMPGSDVFHIGFGHSTNRYAPFTMGAEYTSGSTSTLTFEPYFRTRDGEVRFIHSRSSVHLLVMEIRG